MSPVNLPPFLLLGAAFGLVLHACSPPTGGFSGEQNLGTLMAREAPQSAFFQQELDYLEKHKILLKSERTFLEKQMNVAEETFGTPKSLLWCILFQESRFDLLLNANEPDATARGIGQFTPNALVEINSDTDQYDERTSAIFEKLLKPKHLPLNFELGFESPVRRKMGRWWRVPKRDRTSYFHESTAVLASASYLNNRYWQIRHALDTQNISYDPDLMWIYAAAAYNKGARTIFYILTQQFLLRGQRGVEQLLHDSKLTYVLLTDGETLDQSLRDLWPKKQRDRYIEELVRNMKSITSCTLPESAL